MTSTDQHETPTAPDGGDDQYVSDLCSYVGLRAQAEALNKVLNGAWTFSEIRDRASQAAAQADQISSGRWPGVQLAHVPASTVLAQHPPARPRQHTVQQPHWFAPQQIAS